jgi:hypothetical protein
MFPGEGYQQEAEGNASYGQVADRQIGGAQSLAASHSETLPTEAEFAAAETNEYAPAPGHGETPGAAAEFDPYLAIRHALSPEHSHLSSDQIAVSFGRRPAIVALFSLLGSREPRDAALAALLGRAGRRSVRVNGADVPLATYLRGLSRLALEAAEHSLAETGETAGEVAAEFETPPTRQGVPNSADEETQVEGGVPDAYQIKGGLYTPGEKAFAARNRRGLILTSSVVGKQEEKLASRAPWTIQLSREMSEFEDGALGEFAENYNEFADYFEEVLRAIGRLRDLLSAGAPETPTDMTPKQKFALRPTDDTEPALEKKQKYTAWRDAQAQYAATGGLGYAFEVPSTRREFYRARRAFWRAQDKLKIAIDDAKRLDRPKYEQVNIKLTAIYSFMKSAMTEDYVGAAVSLVTLAKDVLDADKHRAEFDAKMREFAGIVKDATKAIQIAIGELKDAGDIYWKQWAAHRKSLCQRENWRSKARETAAELGQALPPHSETDLAVLAALRMPMLVSDAWRALAIIGPSALKKLPSVLASRSLLEKARIYFTGHDSFGVKAVLEAFNQALFLKNVLTQEEVEDWTAMNKLWEETFTRFFQ